MVLRAFGGHGPFGPPGPALDLPRLRLRIVLYYLTRLGWAKIIIFWVKFSEITPFSNCPKQHWLNYMKATWNLFGSVLLDQFLQFYRLIVWSGEGKVPSDPESESEQQSASIRCPESESELHYHDSATLVEKMGYTKMGHSSFLVFRGKTSVLFTTDKADGIDFLSWATQWFLKVRSLTRKSPTCVIINRTTSNRPRTTLLINLR